MTRYLILSAFLASCNACQPTPVPLPPNPAPVVSDAGPPPKPPHADAASPLTQYTLACAHIAVLGCPEGKDKDCAGVLAFAVTSKITPVNLTCIQSAPDTPTLRKCGFVSCKGMP